MLQDEHINICHNYTGAFLMSAIAGFSDVFGFVALSHLFTAHVTGNMVIIISYLLTQTPGLAPKIFAFPVFFIFASMISFLIELKGIKKYNLLIWFLLEVIFFAALMVFGVTIIPKLAVTSTAYIVICMLPICAMAIHNTLIRTYMSSFPPCTVMTGNWTQFIVDVTIFILQKMKRVRRHTQESEAPQKGVRTFSNVLMGFIMGGALAALGFHFFKFYGLVIELAMLFCIIYFVLLQIMQERQAL